MNLADAIRQAASGANVSITTEMPALAAANAAQASAKKNEFAEAVREISVIELPHERPEAEITVTSTIPSEAHPVRFDLILSPEQLSALFRGVAEAQKSVLTSRETARYLRIPGRKLEEMAQLGQIPAFLIDGKWRFSRNSVDEWLTKQSAQKEMEA